MIKHKVLFVGSRNGSRSFMAEAFLNHLAGDRYEAESAGFDAGELDPQAVEAMREAGVDISGERTKTVFSLYQAGRMFHSVVSVCDSESNERHPIYPGHKHYIDWNMCDPDLVEDREDRETAMRIVRDRIREKVEAFIAEHGAE
ncbi:MAG: arsenate reductase ArsC [Desulfovibrionaceae bacterium]